MTFYKAIGTSRRLLVEMAEPHVRRNAKIREIDLMWGAFVEAVMTARKLPSPPNTRGPSKSAMPESPDEITWWDIQLALVKGVIEEEPEQRATLMPTAAQITRHDVVMDLYHKTAFRGRHDWKRRREALWRYAGGWKAGRVRREYGFPAMALSRMKSEAMLSMISAAEKRWLQNEKKGL